MGGGSGGHVTPITAVVTELYAQEPSAEIRVWCDRKFYAHAAATLHHRHSDLRVDSIASGKLRRYHSLPWWRQALRLRTIVIPNLIDGIAIIGGFMQSLAKLLAWRPDVIFTKGGYVCLPVGVAAAVLRIPLVIHDSDAHPGLTNRVLARFATHIATGAPLEYYNYPKDHTTYVGVPVVANLTPPTPEKMKAGKQALGFDPDHPLVVITGGGLGAKRLNDATVAVLDDLLPLTSVFLISGSSQYDELQQKTADRPAAFQVRAFVSDNFTDVLAAADLVVSRAGATILPELAALAKPTILIPNAYLTGGHQIKNAAVYERAGAAVILDEKRLEAEPLSLVDTINALLLNKRELRQLSDAIQAFAMPDAAKQVAQLIRGAVKH